MAEGEYEHLEWTRSPDVTDRRRPRAMVPSPSVPNPARHASNLSSRLSAAVGLSQAQPGYDDRVLLKLNFDGRPPSELEAIPGLEVISEEPGKLVLVFSTEEGRSEFQRRLDLIQRGRRATRKELFFATKGIDAWTADDRTSRSLAGLLAELEAAPEQEARLDVELWPLGDERPQEAERMVRAFKRRAEKVGVRVLDEVLHPVVLLRGAGALPGIRWMLEYRDVREVTTPPRFQLPAELRRMSLKDLPSPPAPEDSAPKIAVLDSGVVSNHPQLKNVVADEDSFIEGLEPSDDVGHGTAVAGLAVFGDLEHAVGGGNLEPAGWLLSGRILDGKNQYEDQLIENQIRDAVEAFTEDYSCGIFNLSIGDRDQPFADGARLRPLAATLDALAAEFGVLFIVSIGNYEPGPRSTEAWRNEYPRFLLEDEARVLDPGTALNVLTVGGIARHELSISGARYADDPAYQPVARADQPSPITRSGPSYRGAIKPELVEHAGNLGINVRMAFHRGHEDPRLGVLTLNHDFLGGDLFSVEVGTSFSTPKIANAAARILAAYPKASANLLRALLVAHAQVPQATQDLLPELQDRLRLAGYGVPDIERAVRSTEDRVTLMREDVIGRNATHFYEIPLPDDFLKPPARRERRITVAVSHMPPVRPSRADYLTSRLRLRVVRAESLSNVQAVFQRGSEVPNLSETGFVPGPTARDPGTVQCGTWTIRQVDSRWTGRKVFVTVSRVVPTWAENLADETEPYAVVAVVEEREKAEVRYYTQMRAQLRTRARVRVRR